MILNSPRGSVQRLGRGTGPGPSQGDTAATNKSTCGQPAQGTNLEVGGNRVKGSVIGTTRKKPMEKKKWNLSLHLLGAEIVLWE